MTETCELIILFYFPAFIQESDFFMNAMTIAIESQKESMRKRKKAAPKSDSETKAEENGGRKNSDVSSSPTIKSDKDVKPAFKVCNFLQYQILFYFLFSSLSIISSVESHF